MTKSQEMKMTDKVVLIVLLLMLITINSYAQQELKSKNSDVFIVIDPETSDRMMLLPKVALKSSLDQQTISTGKGLQVYNTSIILGRDGIEPGYYLWNGTRWVRLPYQPEHLNLLLDANRENPNLCVSKSSINSTHGDDGSTAYGVNALRRSAFGSPNTALGYSALSDLITGSQNTAIGYCALRTTATGSQNVGVGQGVMFNNTSGSRNTSIGYNALFGNSVGENNTAVGHAALTANTIGVNNTAVGHAALQNSTGANNTALGQNADIDKLIGNNCIAIGCDATTGSNSNSVQIGNKYVANIGGQLAWSVRSDKRIKNDIKENVPGLNFILKLRPISFVYNFDMQDSINGASSATTVEEMISRKKAEATVHTGFAAQEVEKVLTNIDYEFDGLVKPQTSTDLYSLSYELFVVPLVKAVQEQQSVIQKQEMSVNMMKKQIKFQQQEIDELRKVVNQLLEKNEVSIK
ncbi:MAG: tail fiber domain-containing protein [Paludibacter sp.]|nr:tail fiber domain-containing protein [Paludibacter sp.]